MKSYSGVSVDRTDARGNEPLVSCRDEGFAIASQYARKDGQNYPYQRPFKNEFDDVFVREGVAEKLHEVNGILSGYNLELLLWDGYRPIDLQTEVWQFFLDEAKTSLENPTDQECVEFAAAFISDPSGFDVKDSRTWPVHSTGGAIDLTLKVRDSDEVVYMGSIFDDPSELSATRYYESIAGGPHGSLRMAKDGRRILYHSMRSAGFTNFVNEWWHFDWGTQLWALTVNMETGSDRPAFFGTCTDDAVRHIRP